MERAAAPRVHGRQEDADRWRCGAHTVGASHAPAASRSDARSSLLAAPCSTVLTAPRLALAAAAACCRPKILDEFGNPAEVAEGTLTVTHELPSGAYEGFTSSLIDVEPGPLAEAARRFAPKWVPGGVMASEGRKGA